MLKQTTYKVLESNMTDDCDDLIQKIMIEAVKEAVDFCYEKGLLDPDHEQVKCSIKVLSDVPGNLFESEDIG